MKINRKYVSTRTIEDLVQDIDAREPGFKARIDARVKDLGLARQIRALRKKRGIGQEVLAQKAGTAQSVIARLEHGHIPKLDLLSRIADALGTDLRVEFRPRKHA